MASNQDADYDEYKDLQYLVSKSTVPFHSLTVLDLSKREYKNVPPRHVLLWFTQLRTLNLSYNQIERFEAPNLIKGAPFLQELDLSFNNIKVLDDIVEIGHIRSLNKLNFIENPVSKQYTRGKLIEMLLFPKQYEAFDPVKIFTATYNQAFTNITMKRRPDMIISKTAQSFRVNTYRDFVNEKESLISLTNVNESRAVKFSKEICPVPRKTHFPYLTILNDEIISVKDLQSILMMKDLSGIFIKKEEKQFLKPKRYEKLHKKYLRSYLKRKMQRKEELYDVPSLLRLSTLLGEENDLRLIYFVDRIGYDKRKQTPIDYEDLIWAGPADRKLKDAELTIGISKLKEMEKRNTELREERRRNWKELSSKEKVKIFRETIAEMLDERFPKEQYGRRKPKEQPKTTGIIGKKNAKQDQNIKKDKEKEKPQQEEIDSVESSDLSVKDIGSLSEFEIGLSDGSEDEMKTLDELEQEDEYGKNNDELDSEIFKDYNKPSIKGRSNSFTKYDRDLAIKSKKLMWNEKTDKSSIQEESSGGQNDGSFLRLIKRSQSVVGNNTLESKASFGISKETSKQIDDTQSGGQNNSKREGRKIFVANDSTPNLTGEIYKYNNTNNQESKKTVPTRIRHRSQEGPREVKTRMVTTLQEKGFKTLYKQDPIIPSSEIVEETRKEKKNMFSETSHPDLKGISKVSKQNVSRSNSILSSLKLINDNAEENFMPTQSSNLSLNMSPSRDQISSQKEGEINIKENVTKEINQKTGSPRISIFELLREASNNRDPTKEVKEHKIIDIKPKNFTSNSSFVNSINETFLAKGMSHFVPKIKDGKSSPPPKAGQVNNSNQNMSTANQRSMMKFAPGIFNKTIEVPMNFHSKEGSGIIKSKSYLRLIVTKTKAQKARENEQNFLKKSKLIFLNRASSAMISARSNQKNMNKNNNSFSNPHLKIPKEANTINHPIYIYQNANNQQEKEKKVLIQKMRSKIQPPDSLSNSHRGSFSGSGPARVRGESNTESGELRLFEKIQNLLKENERYYAKNLNSRDEETGDTLAKITTTARTRSVDPRIELTSDDIVATVRIPSQKHTKTIYKKDKSTSNHHIWFY